MCQSRFIERKFRVLFFHTYSDTYVFVYVVLVCVLVCRMYKNKCIMKEIPHIIFPKLLFNRRADIKHIKRGLRLLSSIYRYIYTKVIIDSHIVYTIILTLFFYDRLLKYK